ncbi:hypothetical protein [Arthrobacter crystallopoietes]|uniref:Uncharacterized protein n=1 Tax=Crystallibacter crystallopoietes TaxID=37928 RepID=A0A1H1GC19_9MICC|nr:hypothetical protein [Arthrobacter crystallopoietes]AUI52656.1 hypothetical protein AC20117_19465 [Arthrobacter crystallopoietes]SDR10663.1 hypothetical protein SAMN04489742_3984 [Arthrobacter crystallopoietes]
MSFKVFPSLFRLNLFMRGRVELIAWALRVCFVILFVAGFLYLWFLSGNPWPAVGALIGATLGAILGLWFRNRRRRGYLVRGQFEGYLRASAEVLPRPQGKWQFGLATPTKGQIAFQPRWKNSRHDYADVVILPVTGVSQIREPTLVDAIFRIRPNSRILDLETPAGPVHLAGHIEELRKTAEISGGEIERGVRS